MRNIIRVAILVLTSLAPNAYAFLEDLCLPRVKAQGTLTWCIQPTCLTAQPNSACPAQVAEFAFILPGRSMIHHDSTFFLAQAVGYRADVAYWIAAYNEVADYTQYVPIDQCGVQAANEWAIDRGMTKQLAVNTGRDFITAQFNGFQRTNTTTDGPLDHYVVPYSPSGQGTDAHGPMGVAAIYPLSFPKPGYPVRIDDTYQKTLANLRQWAMMKGAEPGLLCTVGLTVTEQGRTTCLTGPYIIGNVPLVMPGAAAPVPPVAINVPAGRKVLNLTTTSAGATDVVYYEALESWLRDSKRTTGKLWKSNPPIPVPVQLARLGLYLHVMQDTSSHSTYCGDNAPSPPGGGDPGTYMYIASDGSVQVAFGNSCATGPHLAGHVQETGTGQAPLPLRDYTALNMTVDELIVFGNEVAKQNGWIVNPELLPPDVTGGKNARGQTAADLKATLVGTIASGTPYSMAEVYKSGVVTRPLQLPNSFDRLHAMNLALGEYSKAVKPAVAFEHLPGNSANPNDTSVCWKAVKK